MQWLRDLWARLTRRMQASAQRRVNDADRTLAELRAKVRELPPEQRAAFAHEIRVMIEEQAQAHNDLNDVLDDRGDR